MDAHQQLTLELQPSHRPTPSSTQETTAPNNIPARSYSSFTNLDEPSATQMRAPNTAIFDYNDTISSGDFLSSLRLSFVVVLWIVDQIGHDNSFAYNGTQND